MILRGYIFIIGEFWDFFVKRIFLVWLFYEFFGEGIKKGSDKLGGLCIL